MFKPVGVLLAAMLAGCSVGQDYQRPVLALPGAWTAAAPVAGQGVPAAWWREFNDPVLNRLEDEGLAANGDLLTAAARVAEARASLRLVQASQYPELTAQGNATRLSQSGESVFAGFPASSKPYNDFTLSLVLNYEIDLWGRLQRTKEAARAQVLGLRANQDAVRLAVASDIAGGYFNLRALEAQIGITQQTIAARRDAAAYQQKQYTHGVLDPLTLRQGQADLAAAETQLPQLQRQRSEQLTALGVLLGRSPEGLASRSPDGAAPRSGDEAATRGAAGQPVDAGQPLADLPVPPQPVLDAPSTLLQRRTDIVAAEQNLRAANALTAVEQAAYFPTFSLNALLGLESSQLEHLLQTSARTWQLGAGVAQPLLNFGQTRANVAAAAARREQADIAYRQVVRGAFKEVLDALQARQTSEAQVRAQNRQTAAQAAALKVAQLRYAAGYSSFLDVLDARRSLFQAQLAGISARQQQLVAAVNLYKALGGGTGAR